MGLTLELEYVDLELEIRGYKTTNALNCWEEWCRVDYEITSGDWLNLMKKDEEVLLSFEVDAIIRRLEELLSGELSEISELHFAEPDFRMIFHPREDLRKDPKYQWIAPGHEFRDVYMEWLVNETVRMVLERGDCVKLLEYLKGIVKNG